MRLKLHSIAAPEWADAVLRNPAMRKLSHEHQYDLPIRSVSGIDLDKFKPGLSALAAELKSDKEYCSRIAELGQRHLADGHVLVHGGCFPGS